MILHPAIVALFLVSLLMTGMTLYGSFFGIRIMRRWDLRSGSEEQLDLERRTYLISTLLSYVLAFQVGSLFLFIHTADALHNQFVGAMCAAGSLNAAPYGYPAFLLKIMNVILAGLWLIINYVDNGAYDYPLIVKKYALLLILAPLIAAESVVQTLYFLDLKADIITLLLRKPVQFRGDRRQLGTRGCTAQGGDPGFLCLLCPDLFSGRCLLAQGETRRAFLPGERRFFPGFLRFVHLFHIGVFLRASDAPLPLLRPPEGVWLHRISPLRRPPDGRRLRPRRRGPDAFSRHRKPFTEPAGDPEAPRPGVSGFLSAFYGDIDRKDGQHGFHPGRLMKNAHLLRSAASFVTAAYAKVRLIPQALRALHLSIFDQPVQQGVFDHPDRLIKKSL